MLRTRRRVVWGIGFLAAFIVGVHLLVEEITRERPNYSKIEDGLWLGGSVAEPPPKTDTVLNLCETPDRFVIANARHEPIRDGIPVPSLDWLRQQTAFIAAERSAGRVVFIHCLNGISRSVMVTAAYLMQREGWSRDQALTFIRERRPGVRPNPAFMQLLLEWERTQPRLPSP